MLKRITFSKYQGTGNDFVMLDNTDGSYDWIREREVTMICNRKTGVGADGLIRISSVEGFDFEVDYFNSDGSKSFCGNGARCSVAFAKELGLIKDHAHFLAVDGEHQATFNDDGTVDVGMLPVTKVLKDGEAYVINTGSPHYIVERYQIDESDIVSFGKDVRYSPAYAEFGINVNLMEELGKGHIKVRTYERGVEDETLSCGTGVTACALAYKVIHNMHNEPIHIETPGGELVVKSIREGDADHFTGIWLSGPAEKVFDGEIAIES